MNILVLIPASKKHKAELEGAAPDAEFAYSSIEAATDKQVASADVIVGNLPAARLHTASHLQLIQLNSAGYDKYAAPARCLQAPCSAAQRAPTARRSRSTSLQRSSPS